MSVVEIQLLADKPQINVSTLTEVIHATVQQAMNILATLNYVKV